MISYIIASYAGSNRTSNGDFSASILQIQLSKLTSLSPESKRVLGEVIVVCPTELKSRAYPEFYQKEKWPGVRFIDFPGPNLFQSYDQYIVAMTRHAKHEYYLLMEDDYCLNVEENPNCLQDLLLCYHDKFPNDIGYLCSMVHTNIEHGRHAAISNGIISRKTRDILGSTMLDEFYKLGYTIRLPAQTLFSRLFDSRGISIEDYRDTFEVLFLKAISPEKREIASILTQGTRPSPIIPVGLESFPKSEWLYRWEIN